MNEEISKKSIFIASLRSNQSYFQNCKFLFNQNQPNYSFFQAVQNINFNFLIRPNHYPHSINIHL